MPRPPSVTPTDGELEVLKVVWKLKSPTAREVFEAVVETRKIELVTISMIMSTMERKGLLRVVNATRPKQYAASRSEAKTRLAMLKQLALKFSGGSIKRLLEETLGRHRMTAEEEREIEREFGKSE